MDSTLSIEDLPDHLSERARQLRPGAPRDGEFVLYWTHHAVRSRENPALDVAVWAGNRLGLPVLVYQGLGAGHRFDSDRHHTFILEGARDLAAALEERGVAYRLFVPSSKREPSPLRGLVDRSALAVVEDFPAPPFPRWTGRLARSSKAPVWAIDASCVLPMQSLGRAEDRAYRFRKRAWAPMLERARRPWRDVEPEVDTWRGEVDFATVDPRFTELPSLVARCDIDHSLGPVPETAGGEVAAAARWRRFKDAGLDTYHRLRNDAAVEPPKGPSRLSAYLHHGHIAPWRIAREALERGGRGAEKYLDELLVWRELAYVYCFHHHRHIEKLSALPEWARDTLERHAGDPRPEVMSWERLLRGRTGDVVWDLAQKSLLVHGELHNNLRMTWGKALLRWTRGPEHALGLLIDLNHRLALDGNDPCSYGGLLWCLGLFDRPFTPERPIFGSVRGRSTETHRKRLDTETYGRRVLRPASGRPCRVAVVGAGVAGLVAGRALADQGHHVRLFDKGRRPGGRLATRESRALDTGFDHGAQYFTAREARFKTYVDAWVEEGVVAPWTPRLVRLRGGELEDVPAGERFVGVPGMRSLAEHLARDLEVLSGVEIEDIVHDGSVFTLRDSTGESHGGFESLLVTAPAPQAARLLACSPRLQKRLSRVHLLPCWAVMARFDESLELDFEAAFIDEAAVAWAARDDSKPRRVEADGETWVLHGDAEWSAEHLESDGSEVIDVLLEAFLTAAGAAPRRPAAARAHRWRYARATTPVGEVLFDPDLSLAAGGDWSFKPKVEGAFLAGQALAGRLLGHLATKAEPRPGRAGETEQLELAFS